MKKLLPISLFLLFQISTCSATYNIYIDADTENLEPESNKIFFCQFSIGYSDSNKDFRTSTTLSKHHNPLTPLLEISEIPLMIFIVLKIMDGKQTKATYETVVWNELNEEMWRIWTYDIIDSWGKSEYKLKGLPVSSDVKPTQLHVKIKDNTDDKQSALNVSHGNLITFNSAD